MQISWRPDEKNLDQKIGWNFASLVLGRDKQKNLSTAAVPIITSDILSDVNLKHSVRAYRYYSQLFGLYLALLNIDKDYDDTMFLRLIFSLQIS